jgi:Cu/Ag efflux protein CusF
MLKSTDVIDDLTSTDTNKPLSANQGKVLQDGKESLFTKNTAFNKDFGSTSGTVAEGNDSRIIDSFQKSSDTLDDITAGATNKHFTVTDKAKLDGIETGATADQTDAEIKTAYENNANTNAFTDADETKLDGIEAGATADQTKADIDALNINADTLNGVHASQLVTKVSSTDNAIVRFNGTGGDVQNSGLTVSDDASQVTLSNSTSTTFTSNKNLTLGQVGDQFGGTFLSLRNRNGENGAIFETTSLVNLVDFVFRMGNGVQRNIRLEGRGSAGKHGANTWHIGGAVPDNPMMAIGDTAMSVGRLGNVAVGTITPTEKLTVAGNILATGNATINGSLSKGSGSFDIPHPNPEKKDTHRLRHYFVETPSAGGNIYKYQFECEEGENYFNLPDYYKFLNKDSLVWCNSFKHFGRAWGEVVENKKIKVITDSKGIYSILIFADRKDKIAMEEFNKYGIEYKLNK